MSKLLSSYTPKPSDPFVREKRSEEACEEHIATETIREDEVGKLKVARLDIEEPGKVNTEFSK